MRFTEARHRKVVSTADAEAIGRIEGWLVDPSTHSIAALRLGRVRGDATLVSWTDIHGFGPDAVTVSGDDRLRPVRDDGERRLASKDLDVLGKQVLSTAGDVLGHVADVEFDPETGVIDAWDLDGGDRIDGARTVGLGAYALVVAAP